MEARTPYLAAVLVPRDTYSDQVILRLPLKLGNESQGPSIPVDDAAAGDFGLNGPLYSLELGNFAGNQNMETNKPAGIRTRSDCL